jgi:hypothetical protein
MDTEKIKSEKVKSAAEMEAACAAGRAWAEREAEAYEGNLADAGEWESTDADALALVLSDASGDASGDWRTTLATLCNQAASARWDELVDDAENGGDRDDDRYGDDDDFLIDGVGFADPGGRSSLRAATRDHPRDQPCPSCGAEDVLTPADVRAGYQCDRCADRAEGLYVGGDY